MKKRLMTIYFILYSLMIQGQMFDNNWIRGDIGETLGRIHFMNGAAIGDSLPNFGMGTIFTTASMSDSLGNLLFYTNGVQIYNKLGVLMENGDSLAPSNYTYSNYTTGLALQQAAMILPFPNHPNVYYLFHHTCGDNTYAYPDNLFYTIVDMNENGGNGKVIAKNQTVVQDFLVHFGMTACKHANGRDWWIIMPKAESNKHYVILFTPLGIKAIYLHPIGYNNPVYCDAGPTCFSPDGTKYARYDICKKKIFLYDFNRCNGNVSNMTTLSADNPGGALGMSFSPDSKFIYASGGTNYNSRLYQYDLSDTNISLDTVGRSDTLWANSPTPFSVMQLAPNEKIYIAAGNTNKMHVINTPNNLSTNCDVGILEFTIAQSCCSWAAVPHFPNYRLSALAEPCDTTSSVQSAVNSKQVQVYPNPVRERLHLESSEVLQKGVVVLFNLAGREMLRQEVVGTQAEIKVEEMAEGMYFYRI
ncbi:MAG: T9SS type A sorting domain-containing protein, partial [Bacteroidia bacterium]